MDAISSFAPDLCSEWRGLILRDIANNWYEKGNLYYFIVYNLQLNTSIIVEAVSLVGHGHGAAAVELLVHSPMIRYSNLRKRQV